MGDVTEVTGMVLSSMNVCEYDRRIVLLTKERGLISAFAKGARKPNSPLTGVTRSFVFGKFQLYEGRSSYTVKQANIQEYFENVICDLDNVYYGCYFAELAEYYAREGIDCSDMINLLYVALKALSKASIPKHLVRFVYEIRLVSINGECPDFFTCQGCQKEKIKFCVFSETMHGLYCNDCEEYAVNPVYLSESTVYALQYIVTAPLERLYTFTLSDQCLEELGKVASGVIQGAVDKEMKSTQMLL